MASFIVVAAATAVLAPASFGWLLAGASVFAVLFFAARHTEVSSVIWLLLAGATLEITLGDLIGLDAYQPTIAAVKAAELTLVIICIFRYGGVADVFNPALAFFAMFIAGMVHGLYPGLSVADSLRSLAGSVAPFAFSFSRLSRRWAQAIITATCWLPLLTVAAACVLDLVGLRPVFMESGGARLAGLGHPAFLASFCLTASYACLIELYRGARSRYLALLGINFMILLLTGARAPLAYGSAVIGLTLTFVQSPVFPRWWRILPVLVGGCLLPLVALVADDLSQVRLFNVLMNETGNLSGRELLWPLFGKAAAASPWVGWGVGAGNAIIPPDSELAVQMKTWAAHNEYLRMWVEGGAFGGGLLLIFLVVWVYRHTAVLVRTDRIIMRLVFLAFAAHAYTDNVLIATTACVFFAFASAVFARGALEREAAEGAGESVAALAARR